jgi:hypothetical protein
MPRSGTKSSDNIRSNNTLKRSISPRNYETNKPNQYTPTKENKNVPIPVQTQSQQPGFLSNIVQGFAWGTGTTIARNMFESKEHIVQSSSNKSNENNCFEYKLCQKLNDPQECFNKMDVSEYTVCKKLFE